MTMGTTRPRGQKASVRTARPRVAGVLALWLCVGLCACEGPTPAPDAPTTPAPDASVGVNPIDGAAPAPEPGTRTVSASAGATVDADATDAAAVVAGFAGGAAGGATPSAGPAGPLAVAYLLPEGEVRSDAPFAIGFDRPMIPLGQVDDDVRVDFVRVTPPTPTKMRWIDPSTLVLTPERPLPQAQTFRLEVLAGATALDGTRLAATRETQFRTRALHLEHLGPRHGVVSRKTGFLAVFSLPVTLAAVQKALSVSADAKLPFWKLELPADAESLERVAREAGVGLPGPAKDLVGRAAILRFAEALPAEAAVEVAVARGLMPVEGDLGTESETRVRVKTHGPLTAGAIRCTGGCDPASWLPFEVAFTTPIDGEGRDGLREFFRVEPDIGALRVSCWGTTCHLGGRLAPDTKYRIRVLPGLTDIYGQKLVEGADATLTTGPLAPFATLRTEGGVLERAEAPWELAWSVRNEDVDVRLMRLDLDAWRALQRGPRARSSWSKEANVPFLPEDARERRLSPQKRNEAQLFRVDLGRELGLTGPALVAAELVRAPDAAGHRARELKLVQITDLHVHARTWRGGALVWVTSWSTGKPVAGVKVRILDGIGAQRFVGETNAEGMVDVPLDPAGGDRGTPAVVAIRGDDTAVLELGWQHHERGGWGGSERARAVTFFEKDLFKAGESAHLKGFVRRVVPGGLALPEKASVQITLRDPEGEVVRKVRTRLGAFGSFDAALEVPADPRYGTWTAEAVATIAGERVAVSSVFRVAVYEPQRTRAGLTLEAEHLLPGGELGAVPHGEWLSGGAMRGAKVTLRCLGQRADWRPGGWAAYVFADDPDPVADGGAPLAPFEHEAEATLGQDGRARIAIPAGANVLAAQSLLVEATVIDPSGRELSTQARAWLQPSERAVGIALPTRVAAAEAPLLVDFVAVGLDGKADASAAIDARLLHRTWKSVRSEQVGGIWEWQTQVEDREVSRCAPEPAPDLPAGVRRCTFTPDRAGMFLVQAEVRDAAGRRRRTRTSVWVSGPGEVSWNPEARDEPLLVADKARYAPGETAHILVKNPIPGAMALITEDRGGVLRRRVVTLPGGAQAIDIPIGADARPNLFVSAVLFRGRQRGRAPARLDLGAPVLRTDAIELEVDTSAAHLEVAVDAGAGVGKDSVAGPGDEVEVDVSVRGKDGKPRQAEVALLVVDEGVLALTGYQTPDPFAPLWARHAHGVTDYALAGDLVRRRVGEEKGDMGGGGDEGGPLVRGNFRDVAHYAPSLQTGPDGHLKARFRLPDNLTAYRVMAVAVAGAEEAGSGQGTLRVGKPLMLQPRLPRYAQVGDVVELSVTARSAADAPSLRGQARLTLTCPEPVALRGPESPSQPFDLQPGTATELRFALRAEAIGRCEVTVEASAGKARDGARLPLEVVDMRPSETSAAFGRSEESVTQTLMRPPGSTDTGGLHIEVASSGVVGLGGSIEPLVDYPYGCAEQTASRLVALLELRRLQADYGLFAERKPEAIAKATTAAVERLFSLRGGWPRGAFRVWPGSSDASVPASAWALLALERARAAKVPLPPKAIAETADWLTQQLHRKGGGGKGLAHGPDARAAILLALARVGKVADADLGAAWATRQELSRSGRLMLALAGIASGRKARRAQSGQLVDAELGTVRVEAHSAWLPDASRDGWSSPRRDRGMLLAAMAAIRPEHPLLAKLLQGAIDDRRGEQFASTQDHAWTLLGLSAVFGVLEPTPPELDVRVQVGETTLGAARFSGRSAARQVFEAAQASLTPGAATPVVLHRQGEGPLYWGMRYRYVQPEVARLPRNAGFVVRRTVTDVHGASPEVWQRGDLAVVTVEVWSGRMRKDVAIVDPLPATLEAVDFSLSGQPEVLRRKLAPDDDALDAYTPHVDAQELTPREVRFFVEHLPAGRSVFRYVVRARGRGVAAWNGSRAEAMYDPEVFGRAAATVAEVR